MRQFQELKSAPPRPVGNGSVEGLMRRLLAERAVGERSEMPPARSCWGGQFWGGAGRAALAGAVPRSLRR